MPTPRLHHALMLDTTTADPTESGTARPAPGAPCVTLPPG